MKSKIIVFSLITLAVLGQAGQAGQERKKTRKQRIESFHLEAKRGNISDLKKIMSRGGFGINTPDSYKNTILHHAARRNSLSVARYFLGRGGKVNARNRAGDTALHLAAARGYMSMINLLLGSGARINIENYDADSAFHSAATNGRLKVARYLMRRGVDNKFIKLEPVQQAVDKAIANTKSFIEKPDLVGGKFEDKTIDQLLGATVRDGDIILADEKCPMIKIKSREDEPFVLLQCTIKEIEIDGEKITFGARIRYSNQWSRRDRTQYNVIEQIKNMPAGISFTGFVRIVDSGHEQAYMYDVYRTAEDKVIIDGRIYYITPHKGEKNKS